MKEPAIIEKDQQITVNFVNNNYVKLAFTNLTDFKTIGYVGQLFGVKYEAIHELRHTIL